MTSCPSKVLHMSYFEAATAGHNLTPYVKHRVSRFFRDAESTRIVRDDSGYRVSIGEQEYPLEYSLYDAIESLQGLLLRPRAKDCLPLAVVIKYESEISWTVDMDVAVLDTQYALSQKN